MKLDFLLAYFYHKISVLFKLDVDFNGICFRSEDTISKPLACNFGWRFLLLFTLYNLPRFRIDLDGNSSFEKMKHYVLLTKD